MADKVLVVGATGFLGSHFVEIFQEYDKELHALIRPQTLSSSEPDVQHRIENVENHGGIIHVGDLHDLESLRRACSQVDYLISTIGGDQIEGQMRLIQAAAATGNVKRFIPSEFGVDVWLPPRGSCPLFDRKRLIQEEILRVNLPYTFVYSNGFMAFWSAGLGQIGLSSPPSKEVVVYGDGDVRAAIVAESDIARYTLSTIDDPRSLNRHVSMLPPLNVKSQNELIDLWESKVGVRLNRRVCSSSELVRRIESFDDPQLQIECWILQIIRSVWIRGEAGALRQDVLEGTELYPDLGYQTVSNYLDQFVGDQRLSQEKLASGNVCSSTGRSSAPAFGRPTPGSKRRTAGRS